MKIAIVALTRGYPKNKSDYSSLIKRNNSIYEHINKLRDIPGMILFHEEIYPTKIKITLSRFIRKLIFRCFKYFDIGISTSGRKNLIWVQCV